MIRVAVCDRDAAERIRLRNAVERYASERGINNIEVTQFPNTDRLEKTVARMRLGFYDLFFCRIGAPSALEAVKRLRGEYPDMRMVLVSDDKGDAIHAYNNDAGFLLLAGSYDDFKRVVSEPIGEVARARSSVASVKTGDGIEKVILADVQFVESSKRGPIIHLPFGKTVSVRGTLQTLFESLSASESEFEEKQTGAYKGEFAGGRRFIKAGSSFIVNLDNVRSAGEGSLIFADGEAIIVPVRKRKAVLDALASFRQR